MLTFSLMDMLMLIWYIMVMKVIAKVSVDNMVNHGMGC